MQRRQCPHTIDKRQSRRTGYHTFFMCKSIVICRIPDDWIDTKRYALFMARDVMRGLITQLQSTSVQPLS